MRRSGQRRGGGTALVALALALAASPASARGLLGLLAGDDAAPAAPAAAPPPETEAPAASNRPVAWISALRGVVDPSAVLYGYVREDQRIDLGQQGEITLTYLSPCREESVVGGSVVVTRAGTRTGGGSSANSRALSCRPAADLVLEGNPADRLRREGPFRPEAWYEVAINSADPVFRWPAEIGAPAQVEVTELDTPEPRALWDSKAYSGSVLYPEDAPALQQGKPYRVRAVLDGDRSYEAVFSFDPDLGYSNAPVNALVVLREQREDAR
ncbi:MAG: hypothetical protein GC201_09110 [Alphaproteobacteria bacterium]|nr:hypothetical protein [Alphaproteobacteria bacterium]